MSPEALRWSVVPVGLLAFAVRIAVSTWVEPSVVAHGAGPEMVILIGALVALAVPFGFLAVLAWWDRSRPAGFLCGDGRFTAPFSPVQAGSQAMLWIFLSGGLVFTDRVFDGHPAQLVGVHVHWGPSIPGVAVCWAVAAGILLSRRPALWLDRDGMTIRGLRHATRIAWDEILPGTPPAPVKRRPRHLTVHLNEPPLMGRYPSTVDISIMRLHVDAAFLAGAIRHYVDHPADRAAIGTADELTRLRSLSPASATVG